LRRSNIFPELGEISQLLQPIHIVHRSNTRISD